MNKKIVCLLISFILGGISIGFSQFFPSKSNIMYGASGHPIYIEDYKKISLEKQFIFLKSMNLKAYRFDVSLSDDEFKKSLPYIDTLINLSKKYKIVLLPMVYTSNLINYNVSNENNINLAHQYAKRFLQCFKSIQYVEIGNENNLRYDPKNDSIFINNKLFYTSRLNNKWFYREASFIKAFINAIHASAPNIKTIIDFTFYDSWYLKALYKYNVKFDIIGGHYYSNAGWDYYKNNYYGILSDVSKFCDGKYVWVTEFNHPQGSWINTKPEHQRGTFDYLVNYVPKNFPLVKAIFIYELLDEPNRKVSKDDAFEQFFGLGTINSNNKIVAKPFLN